jgi:hypothetical protein
MEGGTQTNGNPEGGAFKIIEKYAFASNPAVDPAQFVLALHRSWKEKGGMVAGKSRHSDRQLNELLVKQGTVVRSLTPKLAGKTRLKPHDARALLRLFLSHWEYVGDPDHQNGFQSLAEGADYKPMLSDAQIDEVSRYIVDRMSENETDATAAKGRSDLGASTFVIGEDTAKLIAAEFQESDALFTISSERTLIVADPTQALIGFRDLFTSLFTIDRDDNRMRILVWILDLGTLEFENYEARLRFLNVDSLISRFAALKVFKDQRAEARWNWLRSRTVIVLHDSHAAGHQVARFPAIAAHHFLFDAVPSSWAKSTEYRTLYGSQFERLEERTYTIFLSRSVEDSAEDMKSYSIRYFAHAQFMPDGKDNRQVRGLELPSPGRDYEIAFETVYEAALHVLGMSAHLTRRSINDPKDAVGALSRHGFLLLRLDEFVDLWSSRAISAARG